MDMFVQFDTLGSEQLPGISLGDFVDHPFQPLGATALPVSVPRARAAAPPRFHYLDHLARIGRLGFEAGPRQILMSLAAALRYRRVLGTIIHATRDAPFRRHLQSRPEIWGMVRSSFMSARWQAEQRIALVIDHCRFASRLGPLFDFPADSYIELLRPVQIGAQYRVMLDQPRWLLKEGQLALSIWVGTDRLFSLSFSLSPEAGGTAYVGGLQGCKSEHGLEPHRQLTRDASGMRPRDLTIELFRMLCRSIGVRRILAVSDDIHPWRRPVRAGACEDFFLRYDEAWTERGGHRRNDGFFQLPVTAAIRAEDEIPARKRALYRRRYAMLRSIEADLRTALDSGVTAGRLKRHCVLATA